ncbi:FmdB family transcriptional regulator [Burkholderiales bacterium 8X]|nr:FmdB family transcriptional regulator [Burkholderiales bacterium 8X]
MPIYAYKCSACGFAKDVLQKLSAEPLSVCPNCGASTFSKQVTAAGFQLKGSGWYVTDFRDGGGKKPADKPATAEAASPATDSGTKPAEGGAAAPASTSTPSAASPSSTAKGASGSGSSSPSPSSGAAGGGSAAKGD